MILSELLYKLVLFCDIVRVGKNSYCEFDKLNFGKESTSEEGRCFVLYEEFKSIENLIEGNEYFDGGVSYCVGIDKIDGAVSLDFAIKKCLLEMEAIVSSEMKIVITPIKYPRDEIKNLCTEWHLNEQICNKMLSLIDEDTKLYRCCDDYELKRKESF